MDYKEIFTQTCVCPICKSDLLSENKSIFCSGAKKHCFDISSSGYVNFAVRQNGAGDSKEAVRARRAFLETGYYHPIAEKICDVLSSLDCHSIVDAGCGEGYYTNYIAKCSDGADRVIGFDLSKFGTEYASKYAKQNGVSNVSYAVANLFDLPYKSNCADAVVNIFAPCAEDEFHRVLRDNGVLIVCGAGEDHLMQLKELLYDNVYANGTRSDLPNDKLFELCEKITLKYEIELTDNNMINNLFSMTPYYWRTGIQDKQKLNGVDYLKTIVETEIMIYRKK